MGRKTIKKLFPNIKSKFKISDSGSYKNKNFGFLILTTKIFVKNIHKYHHLKTHPLISKYILSTFHPDHFPNSK